MSDAPAMKTTLPKRQEIERKFLIAGVLPSLEHHPAVEIAQGYLASDAGRDIEVRLRRKGEHCFLTVKQGNGQRRTEVELPLDSQDFDALWPATLNRRVTKTRRRLPISGSDGVIELDLYEGALAGLGVAEVEFPDEAAARSFQPPAWFGREVTDDPTYRNASLARHGWPLAPASTTPVQVPSSRHATVAPQSGLSPLP